MTLFISLLLPLLVAAAGAGPVHTAGVRPDPDSGAELIGQPAPPFLFDRWLDGPGPTQESLRGKAVLIRFWTDECRFCRTTLPAIEILRRRYERDGLVVIGAFHPNEPGTVSDAHVRRWAKRLRYSGRIAVDASWRTLDRWWLGGHPERNWVSTSFLVDRDGRVVWVHGGGEYYPSADPLERRMDKAYRGLERTIRDVLAIPEDAAFASDSR